MPSWEIHNGYAVKMGVSIDVSSKVNELVDSFIFHDIGKKIPRTEAKMLEIILAIVDEEKAKTKWRMSKLRYFLVSNDQAAEAFYLHHALDSFAELTVASLLTEYKPLFSATLDTTRKDLSRVARNFPIGRDNVMIDKVMGFLKNEEKQLLDDKELQEYATKVSEEKKREVQARYEKAIKGMLQPSKESIERFVQRMRERCPPMYPPSLREKMAEAAGLNWAKETEKRRILGAVLDKNSLWEWIRLANYNFTSTQTVYDEARKSVERAAEYPPTSGQELMEMHPFTLLREQLSEDRMKHVMENIATDLAVICRGETGKRLFK